MARIDIDTLTLAQLMHRWPQVLRVFIDWHLYCIGCPIAPFHTLADSAREHGYRLADLEAAVRAAINNDPSAAVPPPARRQSAASDVGP
jgi:hybrid cluster-associated redox disulfide protein